MVAVLVLIQLFSFMFRHTTPPTLKPPIQENWQCFEGIHIYFQKEGIAGRNEAIMDIPLTPQQLQALPAQEGELPRLIDPRTIRLTCC